MPTPRGLLRLGVALALTGAVLTGAVLTAPAVRSATSLAVAGPGSGTWQIGQMWHGGELGGGIVPAGTSIDLAPINGSSLAVYAVAAGRVVQTCVSATQSSVFVDSPGIGVIGYSHLQTGSIVSSGNVAEGQRLGTLATTYQRSACATSWTGPHLHLSFPARYDVLTLAGQGTKRLAVLEFPRPNLSTRFVGRPQVRLTLKRSAAHLQVCANNLPGNVVVVRLTRRGTARSPSRYWMSSQVATSRCVRFANLDGPGRIVKRRIYVARAAVNQHPSVRWSRSGCFRKTGGQGLCASTRRK